MRLTDVADEVIVLNLDRRIDRLELVTAELDSFDIPFIRWKANDHIGTERSAMWHNAHNVKAIIQYAKEKGLRSYCHFDDDVWLIENFHERFAEAFADIPDDWQIISLGQVFGYETRLTPRVVRSWLSWGGHGCIIRDTIYDDLLNAITGDDWADVDASYLMPYINYYVMRPALAFQRAGWSDLKAEYVKNDIY